jgi:hypothetical protein
MGIEDRRSPFVGRGQEPERYSALMVRPDPHGSSIKKTNPMPERYSALMVRPEVPVLVDQPSVMVNSSPLRELESRP